MFRGKRRVSRLSLPRSNGLVTSRPILHVKLGAAELAPISWYVVTSEMGAIMNVEVGNPSIRR